MSILLLGLLGLFLVGLGFYSRRMSKLAAGWPTVTGVIVASSLKSQGEDMPSASIQYSYNVAGVDHVCSGISYSGNWSNEDKELVQKYPVGSKVLVYYDPMRNERAVIDIEPRSVWVAFASAGAFFVFVAFALSL